MDRQITETPRELDIQELELVAGGGEGHGGLFFYSSRGNTSGLIAVGVLNGNNINVLGFQHNIG